MIWNSEVDDQAAVSSWTDAVNGVEGIAVGQPSACEGRSRGTLGDSL